MSGNFHHMKRQVELSKQHHTAYSSRDGRPVPDMMFTQTLQKHEPERQKIRHQQDELFACELLSPSLTQTIQKGRIMESRYNSWHHQGTSRQEQYDQDYDYWKNRQVQKRQTTFQLAESSSLQPAKISRRLTSNQAKMKSWTEPAISVSRSNQRSSQIQYHKQHDYLPSSSMQDTEKKDLLPTTFTSTDEQFRKKQWQEQHNQKLSDQQENQTRLRSEAKPQPTTPGQYCEHWEELYGNLKLTSDCQTNSSSKHL